jgi:hypothetical protein
MFNLFRKKENAVASVKFRHITYASAAEKIKAIVTKATADPDAVFICWFPETTVQLKKVFEEQHIDTARILEARNVHSAMISHKHVAFAECYPLHTKERELVDGWPPREVVIYGALDEPFFQHFGGDKIVDLLQKLGIKEGEPLEHSMISRSIETAQEKVAKQMQAEQTARSQAEWVQKNLK